MSIKLWKLGLVLVVGCLLAWVPVEPAQAQAGQSLYGEYQGATPTEVPLLPEDQPADLYELGLGPWDGFWVIHSADFDGVELTTYFCSDEIAGECVGNEYVRDRFVSCDVDDPNCGGNECTGPCEAEKRSSKSSYGQGCRQDSDCPPSDTMAACDDAKADAEAAADQTCQTAGGANCVCYAHTKVTAKSGKCKTGALARYCKYRCTAKAKGNCAVSW